MCVTYMCTHPLRKCLIVLPSTVPNYTAFALLQHSDGTHFWIFLSPILDMRQYMTCTFQQDMMAIQ